MARQNVAQQVHYYDVEPGEPDKGWVHYTSRVPGWENVDARVSDAVRSIADVNDASVGYIPDGKPRPKDSTTRLLLAEEAVRVSLIAPTWLDRVMTRSVFRDAEEWQAEGKAIYQAQRAERRRKFLRGELIQAPQAPPKLPAIAGTQLTADLDPRQYNPDALEAHEWERRGNYYDPDLHFAGVHTDTPERELVRSLVRRFARHVCAYCLYEPFPGTYSLELQFSDREQMMACRRLYQEGPPKPPKRKRA